MAALTVTGVMSCSVAALTVTGEMFCSVAALTVTGVILLCGSPNSNWCHLVVWQPLQQLVSSCSVAALTVTGVIL